LKRIGFSSVHGKHDVYELDGAQAIWNLFHRRLPEMETDWQLLWTPAFSRALNASNDAELTVSAGRETDSWFETQCVLKAEDGTAIPWEAVTAAVEQGSNFIRLDSGGIVRLPGEVLRILTLLLAHAPKNSAGKCRFSMYSAISVADVLEPYWEGRRAAWQELRERLLQAASEPMPELPDGLVGRLRDYQKEGVRWLSVLAECGFHGVLADEMGLGKTIQALAAVAANRRKISGPSPSIIICPTSLLENWLVEANRFVPQLRCMVIRGNDRHEALKQVEACDLIITSYALLRRDILEYEQVQFDYVILDEAQHIKNPHTANAKTCKELRGNHRLILTGTPVENSLTEVWSLFDFLLPGYLGTHRDFRQLYENTETPEQQANAARELAIHIKPFILRRTKRDVCAELPPKLEQVVYCEFGDEQRRLYDAMMAAGRQLLAQARKGGWQDHRFELLSILLRLRQICCHPELLPSELRDGYEEPIPSVKTELAQEVILEAIDSGHRVLLFSQFTGVLALFPPWLKKNGIAYEYLDGSTTDRQQRVDRFNADTSIPVFLLSLKAGGTGLNLTGADTVIHYDQWWNPMVEDQATDRTHRIGQTRTVTAVKLVARHTIEEKILDLQASKRNLFQQLLSGAPTKLGDLTAEDVEFLLGQPD
jgi:non-specific serine/threonine protein kinase